MTDIEKKKYRRIFTAPEQLGGADFQRMFRLDTWARSVKAIMVDEAHVVVEWGNTFRPHYKQLSDLRHCNGYRIPIMALSATLPIKVYESLHQTLELKHPAIINIGSDRPNILMHVAEFQYSMASFLDIRKHMPEIATIVIGGERA